MISGALSVEVREFRFQGNRIFNARELAKVVAPYTGRRISSDELEEARRALTRYYVNQGYVNSGALLEDQPVTGGIVTFTLVEGRLDEVTVTGLRRLRSSYVKARLEQAAGPPLNVGTLREQLLVLKENPNIQQIEAELKPGVRRGESALDVQVVERGPFHLGLQARNDRPPSVGAETVELLASDQNLTGFSDALELQYGVAQRDHDHPKLSGAGNLSASYSVPVSLRDSVLELNYTRNDYSVIEEPFDSLDIQSQSSTYRLALRQPLLRTVKREFSLTLAAERRHSESELLGQPFSFSPGAVQGESDDSAIRLTAEHVERRASQVLALRSAFSWGLDILGATKNGTSRDGRFVTWQGQAQYVNRLWGSANQLIAGASFQWANDPLLSLEQCTAGGAHTVRGYRENQMVRDMGALASLEVRVPILLNKAGASVLQLAPFFDFGAGWNVGTPTPGPRDLASVGIGLLFDPTAKLHGQLYWGHRLREVTNSGGHDAQDLGLHFALRLMAF